MNGSGYIFRWDIGVLRMEYPHKIELDFGNYNRNFTMNGLFPGNVFSEKQLLLKPESLILTKLYFMKTVFTLACVVFVITACGQHKDTISAQPDPNKKLQIVEASCGECQFGLPGKSCDLAVRVNGKAYFVDGTSIDEHGDAHANDGFCEAIRKAEVQGEIVNNRFKVTYFKLIKPKEPDTKNKLRG